MLLTPSNDEEEHRVQHNDYAAAMEDWKEFADMMHNMYGVDMACLEKEMM